MLGELHASDGECRLPGKRVEKMPLFDAKARWLTAPTLNREHGDGRFTCDQRQTQRLRRGQRIRAMTRRLLVFERPGRDRDLLRGERHEPGGSDETLLLVGNEDGGRNIDRLFQMTGEDINALATYLRSLQ